MTSSQQDSRWSLVGCAAVGLSLLAVACCSLVFGGLAVGDLRLSAVDRYWPLEVGQAALYRVTYADGSTGLLSRNVVIPSVDTRTRVILLNGAAYQVRSTYTNWQGQGTVHRVDDGLSLRDGRLFFVSFDSDGQTAMADPPLPLWDPALTSAQTVEGQTTIGQIAISYTLRGLGREATGPFADALKAEMELRAEGGTERWLMWLAPGVGLVRFERWGSGDRPEETWELVNDSQSPRPVEFARGAEAPPAPRLFREGPARRGRVAGEWPSSRLNLAWRYTGDVAFTASPLAGDGLLYVAGQDGVITALDAAQGTVRWQFATGGPSVSTPALAENILYIGSSDKRLWALSADEGLFLWSFATADNVAASPAVADGLVVIGSEDRAVYALDARSGALRWTHVTGDRIVSSAAIAGGVVYVGSDDGVLYALRAGDGEVMWRFATGGGIESTPAVADGVVYVGSMDSHLYAVNAVTGEAQWAFETDAEVFSSPAVDDERVYVGDSHYWVYAVDRATGELVWRQQTSDQVVSSPLVVGDKLVFADIDGYVYLADAATGQVLDTFEASGAFTGSPAWADGALYLAGHDQRVYALRPDEGARGLSFELLWEQIYGSPSDLAEATPRSSPALSPDGRTAYFVLATGDLWAVDVDTGQGRRLHRFGQECRGRLVLADGVLYFGSLAGTIHAFDLASGQPRWRAEVGGSVLYGPAVGEGRVFVHAFGGQQPGALHALDAATGGELWRMETPLASSTPILDGDTLYLAADRVYALDAATGAVRWQSEPFTSGDGLALHGNTLYVAGVGSDDPPVTVMALDAASGGVLWSARPSALFLFNRPAYDPATDTVFVGGQDGNVYALSAAGGAERWRFGADGAIQADVVLRDGVLYFNTATGTLYALDPAQGRLLADFKFGTPVDTYVGPTVLDGRLITAKGSSVIALGLGQR